MIRRAPLLPLAAGLLAGVCLSLAGLRWPLPAALTLPLAASPPLAPTAFVSLGWVAADLARASSLPIPAGPVELEGRVGSVPNPVGDKVRYALRSRAGELIEVTSPPAEWPLAAGDQVRLQARLRRPPGPRNPGAADQAERQAAVGVGLLGDGLLPPVRVAPPSPLAWLERGRERFAEAAMALPEREAALVRAIGTGDRAALDQRTNDSFARSGLAHVLAVSGLHLVVVAAGLERLLRGALGRVEPLARRYDARRAAAALAVPLVVLYTLATGAGFPVVRAAIASGLLLGATLLDREGRSDNTLALAAAAMLAVEPGALLDPSFQLSLASVAGLVALATPLRRALPLPAPPPRTWRARLQEPLVAGLCATLAASLATAPVLALHFRRLPALGIVANLAGVPIGTALTALTAGAAVLAAAWPPLAVPVLWVARTFATALLLVSDAAAAPDFAVIGVASPGPVVAALGCALALSLARLRGRWRAAAALAFAACLALPGPLRAWAAARRGVLEVIFTATGQSEATLLRLPDGSAILVDGGGTFPGGPDPGGRDLVPLLRDLGVRRLSAVIVSHPHPDHVLGLAAVAAALPIDRLILGGNPPTGAAAEALAGLPRPERLAAGQGWSQGGARFEVVSHPWDDLQENDGSLVFRLEHGRVALLFPGDAEAAGEARALSRGAARLAADLVKVPHHGSRTSSGPAFVAAVHPTHAVACVGIANRFGFPDPGVVERWRAVGAEFHRTDEGAVRFLSDGVRLRQVAASGAVELATLLSEAP